MLIIERRLLGRLCRFYSLAELNTPRSVSCCCSSTTDAGSGLCHPAVGS